jgi:nucleotide-binding universal stress UspA family protein
MYRNLLVPIAFHGDTDDGIPALAAAKSLRSDGGRITLLHVLEEMPHHLTNYLPDHYQTDLHRAVAQELAHRARGSDGVSTAIAEGKPAPAILDYAADQHIDCIVIASHRPGLQDWLLGSTAARVVRHARCSVHILR